MTVRINLNKAQRQVLPEGDYVLDVNVCEQAQAGSGKDKLHIEYLPSPDHHPEFASVRLFSDISLQEQSWFRVVELLDAAGVDLEGGADAEGNVDFEPEQLVGARVAAAVGIDDTYDGTPRNKVGTVYPLAEMEEAGKEPE